MKIRSGFVSNSSSASFCILGIEVPETFNTNTFYNRARDFKLLELEQGLGEMYSQDQLMIGASPEIMKDTETLWHFKKRICEEFKKLGMDVKPEDLRWFIDGGFNG